jgi:hypothetical protein
MGRLGSGPGEFRQPTRLGWAGDTLWVIDVALRRATFLGPGPRAIKTLQLTVKVGPPFVQTAVVAVTANGALLVDAATENLYEKTPLGSSAPTRMGIFVAARSGEITRSLGLIELRSHAMRLPVLVNGTSGFFSLKQPFADDPLFAVTRDGATLAIVDRRAGESPGMQSFTVTKLTTMGDTIFSRKIPYAPRALDDETFSAALEPIRHPPLRTGTSIHIEEGELRQAVYRPKYLLPVEDVVLSRDGRAWLRRETTSRDARVEYLILGPTGSPEAIVSVPSVERVVETDGKTVLTITREPEEAPIISLYRIVTRTP